MKNRLARHHGKVKKKTESEIYQTSPDLKHDTGRVDRPLPISAARSRIMKAIRSQGNRSTEARVAQILRSAKLNGWRRHSDLPGTPDFSWRPEKVALFVDGCFWHGCPHCYRAPRHNAAFWELKIQGNRRRDRRVNRELRQRDWVVVRVWECKLERERFRRQVARALSARRSS